MTKEPPRYDGCIVPILIASIAAFCIMFYARECRDPEPVSTPTPVVEETIP